MKSDVVLGSTDNASRQGDSSSATVMSPEWLTPSGPRSSTCSSTTTDNNKTSLKFDTPTPVPVSNTHRIRRFLPSTPPSSLDTIYSRELETLLHPSGPFHDSTITHLSLRQFIAICLLGHHCKSHSRPFLRIEPVPASPGSASSFAGSSSRGTATSPGDTGTSFRVLIKDSILLSGLTLISHDDEFPTKDARKRNNKTCVFGCMDAVEINGQMENVRQHVSSQTYPPLSPAFPLSLTILFKFPSGYPVRCVTFGALIVRALYSHLASFPSRCPHTPPFFRQCSSFGDYNRSRPLATSYLYFRSPPPIIVPPGSLFPVFSILLSPVV